MNMMACHAFISHYRSDAGKLQLCKMQREEEHLSLYPHMCENDLNELGPYL